MDTGHVGDGDIVVEVVLLVAFSDFVAVDLVTLSSPGKIHVKIRQILSRS